MKRSVKRSDQNGDFRCSFPLRVFPCVRRGVWFGHQIKTNWGRAVSFRLDLTNPSLRGQLGSTAPPPPPPQRGRAFGGPPPLLGGGSAQIYYLLPMLWYPSDSCLVSTDLDDLGPQRVCRRSCPLPPPPRWTWCLDNGRAGEFLPGSPARIWVWGGGCSGLAACANLCGEIDLPPDEPSRRAHGFSLITPGSLVQPVGILAFWLTWHWQNFPVSHRNPYAGPATRPKAENW